MAQDPEHRPHEFDTSKGPFLFELSEDLGKGEWHGVVTGQEPFTTRGIAELEFYFNEKIFQHPSTGQVEIDQDVLEHFVRFVLGNLQLLEDRSLAVLDVIRPHRQGSSSMELELYGAELTAFHPESGGLGKNYVLDIKVLFQDVGGGFYGAEEFYGLFKGFTKMGHAMLLGAVIDWG